MDLKDAQSGIGIRFSDEDEPIEPPRPEKRRVDHVGAVGRTHDRDVPQPLHAVHGREHLRNDPLPCGAVPHASDRGYGIQLVEEYDARSHLLGAFEDLTDGALALAHPFAGHLRAVDRDEVGARLVGQGLGDEGLPGSGRAVQEDALAGLDTEPVIGSVSLLGDEDLLDPLPHVVQSPHILPGYLGDLDEHLPHAAGLHVAERRGEVVHGDLHRFEDLGGDRLVQIELVHPRAEAVHRRLPAQRGQVRSHEPLGERRELLRGDIRREGHVPEVDGQDVRPGLPSGYAYLDLPVEPPRPPQRRIDGVLPVGGSDDYDVPSVVESVHEGEELRHDPPLDLAVNVVPVGCDRVDLVQEHDARSVLGSLLEDLPEALLALTVVLSDDLRAADRE